MLFSRCQRSLMRAAAASTGAERRRIVGRRSQAEARQGLQASLQRSDRLCDEPGAVPDLLRRVDLRYGILDRRRRHLAARHGGSIHLRLRHQHRRHHRPGRQVGERLRRRYRGRFFNNTAGTSNGTEVRPMFSSADPADVAAWPDEARVPCSAANTDPASPCVTLGLGTDPAGDLFSQPLQGTICRLAGRPVVHVLGRRPGPARLAGAPARASRSRPAPSAGTSRPATKTSSTSSIPSTTSPARIPRTTRPSARRSGPCCCRRRPTSRRPTPPSSASTCRPAATRSTTCSWPPCRTWTSTRPTPTTPASTCRSRWATPTSTTSAMALPWAGASIPSIFGTAPFFPGVGFVGVKYLRSPNDPATGLEVGLTLFGTFSRSSGSLQDPNDDKQLYRYITGGLTSADGACSLPNPLQAHICFVNISSQADMRFFESSGPLNLAPGGSGTIVVAYIFAAPVASEGCPGAGCDVKPATTNANLTIMGNASRMASGVNKIDTMTGYLGFNDDGDGNVTQTEINAVPGSLLGKAKTAQTVFDNKFLLPFAPDRPDFFLVPGNNQVTVLWNRSATETTPDPFFAIASQPTTIDPLTGPRWPTRCTTRTSAASTSRATGSIAAGWTTRASCSSSRSSTTRRTRADGASSPTSAATSIPIRTARPSWACSPTAPFPSPCRCPASRSSVRSTSTSWGRSPRSVPAAASCSPATRRRCSPASSIPRSRTSRAAGWRRASAPPSPTAACRSCTWTTTSGTASGTSTPSRRST